MSKRELTVIDSICAHCGGPGSKHDVTHLFVETANGPINIRTCPKVERETIVLLDVPAPRKRKRGKK